MGQQERPDDILQQLNLDTSTNAHLETAVRAFLTATGAKPFCIIQPYVDAIKATMWQQRHTLVGDGVLHRPATINIQEGQADAGCLV